MKTKDDVLFEVLTKIEAETVLDDPIFKQHIFDAMEDFATLRLKESEQCKDDLIAENFEQKQVLDAIMNIVDTCDHSKDTDEIWRLINDLG